MGSKRDRLRRVRPSDDEFQSYVEHPRYGRGPRYTGLNPSTKEPFDAHWHSDRKRRVPDTAIEADGTKQSWVIGAASYGYGLSIRYYFDDRRVCRDCKRPFLFFAKEQKHWYEKLGIPLEVDCVRCCACRRKYRGANRAKKRYSELLGESKPSASELVELVTISLDLIAEGEFSAHQKMFDRIRMWLKQLSKVSAQDKARMELTRRLTDVQKEATQRLKKGAQQGDSHD